MGAMFVSGHPVSILRDLVEEAIAMGASKYPHRDRVSGRMYTRAWAMDDAFLAEMFPYSLPPHVDPLDVDNPEGFKTEDNTFEHGVRGVLQGLHRSFE